MISRIPHHQSESALSGVALASGVAEVWAAASEDCTMRRIRAANFASENWRIVSLPTDPLYNSIC
jgi:hypothetical protein